MDYRYVLFWIGGNILYCLDVKKKTWIQYFLSA